jgi:hypothetical protein
MRLLVPMAVLLSAAPVLAAPSSGHSVYLNGQVIDSDRSQKFENVTVEIDGDGNVRITSDTYKVETGTGAGTQKQPDRTPLIPHGTRYWLISEENSAGMSQYDFDIFLNGALVKTVKSGDGQVVEDVTKFVIPGSNTVTITARKNFGNARKSESKDLYQRIYIGKGALNETGAIVIDNPDIDYRKTAADVQNFADQMSFTPK